MMDDWCHNIPTTTGMNCQSQGVHFSSGLDDIFLGSERSGDENPPKHRDSPRVKSEALQVFFCLTFQSSEHSTSKTKWKIEKWFGSWLPPRVTFRSFWIKKPRILGPKPPNPKTSLHFFYQRHSMRTHGVKCLKRHSMRTLGGFLLEGMICCCCCCCCRCCRCCCCCFFLMTLILNCLWFCSWSSFLRSPNF